MTCLWSDVGRLGVYSEEKRPKVTTFTFFYLTNMCHQFPLNLHLNSTLKKKSLVTFWEIKVYYYMAAFCFVCN